MRFSDEDIRSESPHVVCACRNSYDHLSRTSLKLQEMSISLCWSATQCIYIYIYALYIPHATRTHTHIYLYILIYHVFYIYIYIYALTLSSMRLQESCQSALVTPGPFRSVEVLTSRLGRSVVCGGAR